MIGKPKPRLAPEPPPRNGCRWIPLTQGKFALVDAKDYEWLSQHIWYYDRYPARRVRDGEKSYILYMHRAILNAPKGMEIDHINGDKLDNRRENLRICTHEENMRNTKLSAVNTSGYKGVFYTKSTGKWRASIRNTKTIHLGYFDSKEEAKAAYDKAALALHGAFARLK